MLLTHQGPVMKSLSTFLRLTFLHAALQMSPAQEQMETPIAGGWKASNLNDAMVLEAAEFCRSALQSQTLDMQQKAPNYSFEITPTSSVKVIRALQQVVAGLNFKLTIIVESSGSCSGGFTATVYDRFGEKSLTEWGHELSCAEGQEIMDAHKESAPGDAN